MTSIDSDYQKICDELRQQPPPKPAFDDIFVGDGDYVEISLEFLRYFIEVGGVRRSDSVLDVGSGIGRMAIALTRYLDPQYGRYLGFDPVKKGIEWCKLNITSAYPNFHFRHINVSNEYYNNAGVIESSKFEFPVKDSVIDFIIATSVFTHLYEEDIENYLSEMDRVLAGGGRIFSTAYLFEGESPPTAVHGDYLQFSEKPMPNRRSHHVDGYPPLAAVAFQEDYFRELAGSLPGRKMHILPGRWRGAAGPWFQDVVLVE
jgi:ubiquinone/menaquinone biosynthesis C-methylase UbiE